jgi:riboflavin kinase / FMN adenylyltransferase
MTVLHSLTELSQVPGPLCIAIGVFDGVHLGHQALVREAMTQAAGHGGAAVALTFHPHPARLLRPQSAPHLLTSTPHKVALIAELGCPYLLQVAFDEAFAQQSPQAFIEALCAAADVRMICVGRDWAFGKNRAGNVALLKELGTRLGFETLEIPPVAVEGEVISSTRIRRAVEEGDFASARKFLGREYTILGTVRHGAGLGGKIGFPTANLAAHSEQFPPDGVYAVCLLLRGEWHKGVANVGVRPTVANAGERLLEAHIFDFQGDCYGEDVEVRFEYFLRPEQKFASVEELKKQIASDAARARELLG